MPNLSKSLCRGTSTTVAYRPFTALTYYILWLSSALSTKCAVLIHYATVVLETRRGVCHRCDMLLFEHPGRKSPGCCSSRGPARCRGQRQACWIASAPQAARVSTSP